MWRNQIELVCKCVGWVCVCVCACDIIIVSLARACVKWLWGYRFVHRKFIIKMPFKTITALNTHGHTHTNEKSQTINSYNLSILSEKDQTNGQRDEMKEQNKCVDSFSLICFIISCWVAQFALCILLSFCAIRFNSIQFNSIQFRFGLAWLGLAELNGFFILLKRYQWRVYSFFSTKKMLSEIKIVRILTFRHWFGDVRRRRRRPPITDDVDMLGLR